MANYKASAEYQLDAAVAEIVPPTVDDPTAHPRLKIEMAYVVTSPIYLEIHDERIRAHVKHAAKGNSRENAPASDPQWLAIVGEEYGEVCHALTYDSNESAAELRAELIQLAAMAAAWIAAIDAEKEKS